MRALAGAAALAALAACDRSVGPPPPTAAPVAPPSPTVGAPAPAPPPRRDLNKLGLHVNVWTPGATALVRWTRPRALKVLGGAIDPRLLREYRRLRPDGLLIVRVHFPDERLERLDARLDATLRLVDRIADLRPIVEVPINERYQSELALLAYGRDTVRAVERIAAAGYRPAVGNFSVGNPPRLRGAVVDGRVVTEETRDWPHFYPALAAARRAGGYLSLHEFWAPGLELDGWHALRYRRAWAELPVECRLPVLITECGVDRAMVGQPQGGWQVYPLTADQYAAQLRTYRDALAEDDYVHGACVFAGGTYNQWPKWRSFDITDFLAFQEVLEEEIEGAPLWYPGPGAPLA